MKRSKTSGEKRTKIGGEKKKNSEEKPAVKKKKKTYWPREEEENPADNEGEKNLLTMREKKTREKKTH